MAWVAGVDGRRGGWVVVLRPLGSLEVRGRLVERFREVLGLLERPSIVGVDIPIGLLDRAVKGGRECDREARRILGQPRGRSVFSPPVRGALTCKDYPSANRANKASSPEKVGISKQSFALREKLLEVNSLMTPRLQDIVREVHPELSFYELNGRKSMNHGKKARGGVGLRERRPLLLDVGFGPVIAELAKHPRGKLGEDDILDACVACWTAEQIVKGEALRVPENPPRDRCGLRMEMWR